MPQSQQQPLIAIPLDAEAYKNRVITLMHQLLAEQPEQRVALALAFTKATTVLARLQGVAMTGAIALS